MAPHPRPHDAADRPDAVAVDVTREVGVLDAMSTDVVGILDAAAPIDATTDRTDVGITRDAIVDTGVLAGDAGPPRPHARPIRPLSTSAVGTLRPTLRWVLPENADGATVILARDRGFTRDLMTLHATGVSVRPDRDLAPGWWFWRTQARRGSESVGAPGPAWQFFVEHRETNADLGRGSALDVNGDGYVDLLVANPFFRAHDHAEPLPRRPRGPRVDTLLEPFWRVADRPDRAVLFRRGRSQRRRIR
jgi:hypothetical protein